MSLEISFELQLQSLRNELRSEIEISRNYLKFEDMAPAILDLEEAAFFRRGPYAKYSTDVLLAYFKQFVEPNWSANQKYLIPAPSVDQDYIECRPCIAFMYEMTPEEIANKEKLRVELTLRIPPGDIVDVMLIYKNYTFQSSNYFLAPVPSLPPTKRNDISTISLKMNDEELQRRLRLSEKPTKWIYGNYHLKRLEE